MYRGSRITRMDCSSRALIRCFVIAAMVFVSGCSAGRSAGINSDELPEPVKWAPLNVDMVELLTVEPAECLPFLDDQENVDNLALGRVAFRSPYLLGGQAARQGMSCHSCHTNGGINQHFFIDGLSDEPGTADVTNFHFSKTLGDLTFNPKPIPSLAALTIPKDETERQEREQFVLRLVEQEFDGAVPSETVKNALLDYVNAFGATACGGEMHGIALLKHRIKIIDSNIWLVSSSDRETSAFAVSALRNELGRLSTRFPDSKSIQEGLRALSADLKLNSNMSKWPDLKAEMIQAYDRSYFSPEYVRQKIGN